MNNQLGKRLNRMLRLDYSADAIDKMWIRSGDAQRRAIGVLGMLLPLLLPAVVWVYTNYRQVCPIESISHYYYTRANSVFVIIMGVLGFFLLLYKGFKPIDFYVSALAGLCVLLVLLFPTTNLDGCCANCQSCDGVAVTWLRDDALRVKIHYISAGIFLASLAYMSLFIFTRRDKTDPSVQRRKHIRNRIYITAGIIIFLALLVIILQFAGYGLVSDAFYNRHHLTFWMETVAVESFGVSWLIKGDTLFRN